jgi:hypothetical protein
MSDGENGDRSRRFVGTDNLWIDEEGTAELVHSRGQSPELISLGLGSSRTARSRALLRCRKRSIYSSRKTNSFFRALLSEPLFPALSNGALGTLLLKFSFRRREPE